jgi:hypothetical protein
MFSSRPTQNRGQRMELGRRFRSRTTLNDRNWHPAIKLACGLKRFEAGLKILREHEHETMITLSHGNVIFYLECLQAVEIDFLFYARYKKLPNGLETCIEIWWDAMIALTGGRQNTFNDSTSVEVAIYHVVHHTVIQIVANSIFAVF